MIFAEQAHCLLRRWIWGFLWGGGFTHEGEVGSVPAPERLRGGWKGKLPRPAPQVTTGKGASRDGDGPDFPPAPGGMRSASL